MNRLVEIKIIGNEKKGDEYKAANELRNLLFESLPIEARGKIIIQSNVTLFGQEVKDIDIILLGSLTNCLVPIKVNNGVEKVKVYNFCIVVELKKHPTNNVMRQGAEIYVKYLNGYHSVTLQSNKQKYALKNFFESIRQYSPYIFNLIWLKSMTSLEVTELLTEGIGQVKANVLSANCTFFDIIQLIAEQGSLRKKKDGSLFISGFDNAECGVDEWLDVLGMFERTRSAAGELTRKKIECISKNLLGKHESLGEDLTIYRGRAGTGKTLHLLRTAFDIAKNQDKRALILTYNHALASDIKRLLAFAEIPDAYDNRGVRIMTLHKFFYRLLAGVNLIASASDEFLERYEELLSELLQYLKQNVIDKDEVQKLIKNKYDDLYWDYILVDEGQDWSEVERDILCAVYGANRIIVADGVEQMVKGNKVCDWKNIDGQSRVVKQSKSRRQKENLVSFVNDFAKECGMNHWTMSSTKEMVGGRVVILTIDYLKSNIHQKESMQAIHNGNENYDYLFVVPPRLVIKTTKGGKGSFSQFEEFRAQGINIWDGTRVDLRAEYPIDVQQYRLLQYDSCRGLEGWTVVCLEFDEFLSYKNAMYQGDSDCDDLLLETPVEKKNRYLFNWAFIPLTRAIDTLIITLQNPQSDVGMKLRRIHERNPDYVEWIE